MAETLGASAPLYFVANAPSGHMKVEAAALDGRPATLFFHAVELLPGDRPPALGPKAAATGLEWVTAGELGAHFGPEQHAYLRGMLPTVLTPEVEGHPREGGAEGGGRGGGPASTPPSPAGAAPGGEAAAAPAAPERPGAGGAKKSSKRPDDRRGAQAGGAQAGQG